MTILAPRSLRSAMIELLSKALSAMKPSKARPSMSRRDAHRIETMAGHENETDQVAERVGQRQNPVLAGLGH